MTLYAPLAYTKSLMGADSTIDDAKLLREIREASRRIDREMGASRPLFLPFKEPRGFLVTSDRVTSFLNTFDITGHRHGGYLLELDGVTVGTSTLAIGTDVDPFPSTTVPPFKALRLTCTACRGWYGFETDPCGSPLFVNVPGIWGVHRYYEEAWARVDALTAGINASVTSLTVADVDGADMYGLTPRISAGNILRLEDEYMEILSTTIATNTVTVRRGVLGTTAATHVMTTPVDVFMVEEPIMRATARQAGLLYARHGAYTTVEVQGMTEVRYPADLLQEVRGVLQDMQFA